MTFVRVVPWKFAIRTSNFHRFCKGSTLGFCGFSIRPSLPDDFCKGGTLEIYHQIFSVFVRVVPWIFHQPFCQGSTLRRPVYIPFWKGSTSKIFHQTFNFRVGTLDVFHVGYYLGCVPSATPFCVITGGDPRVLES